jgi:hypothetical protein
MYRQQACPDEGPSSHKAPRVTLDDLFWFLYLYPLRVLAALGFLKLIYALGSLF